MASSRMSATRRGPRTDHGSVFAASPLYSSAGISPSSIFACARTARDLQQLTDSATQATGAPSWTPDGRILFFHNNSRRESKVHPQPGAERAAGCMDADGGNEAPLSNTFPDLGQHHERMGVLRILGPDALGLATCAMLLDTGGIVPPVSPCDPEALTPSAARTSHRASDAQPMKARAISSTTRSPVRAIQPPSEPRPMNV